MTAPVGISDAEMLVLMAQVTGRSPIENATAALGPLAPEPICLVCGNTLHPRDADLGTHGMCDPHEKERARGLAPTPPPTLPALTDALKAYDDGKERSMQAIIGPSEIGVPCDRRLGYALRNIAKRPGELGWAPLMGTAVHAVVADALKLANQGAGRTRWLIEERVRPDLEISGSCDAYDADTDTVIDWKLVGASTLEKVQKHGPGQQYETQAHLYGRGWQRAGRDPRFVRIVFLPRNSHRIAGAVEWTAPYSRLIAEAALERLHYVAARLDALDVDRDPAAWNQVDASPSSDNCYFCPYRRDGLDADATGCPGQRSKPALAVDDYLKTLPLAPRR